ncbi:MAG: biotin/lipoyl-binding protein [Proteobacteria bacterium]|nr:biotin/lipoyl-binding protein [Pseudomonadota bacterium]MBU1232777.1 biotin/lipoyl-binding protein [Pseudomonadota bacterium]MBU1418803.1 biotin/lipoyl-binding protein [Pseudomonadota bacterium]MBU1453511.1 biotin/lipoyl-binding protein [Pseudomonadota bacterium]
MKEYKLNINDNSYTVIIKDVTDDAVLAEVNGKKYVVHIDTIANISPPMENQGTTLLTAASPSPRPSSSPMTANSGTIVTPIPGQIISISVSRGEKIRCGQKLLILEAMKLENSITATMDGTVSEILVAEGDVVNQGQPLIVLV